MEKILLPIYKFLFYELISFFLRIYNLYIYRFLSIFEKNMFIGGTVENEILMIVT